MDDPNPSTTALRESRVVVIRPAERVLHYPLSPVAEEITTLVAPLQVEGRSVGTIGFRRHGDHVLAPDDHDLLESFGEQCAQALERARLRDAERAAREEAEELSRTLERMHDVAFGRDLAGGVLGAERAVCEAARAGFDASAAALWEQDGEGVRLLWRAPPSPALPVGHRFAFDEFPVFADALRAGRPEFVADLEADEPDLWQRYGRVSGSRSQLRLPLAWGGEREELLVVSWAERATTPSTRVLAAAARFADQAALTLVQARRREVEQEARRLHERLELGLLPQIEVPDGLAQRVAVAAHYRPGDARLQLGGDFYDCVGIGDGRLAVLVGDVAGHGPRRRRSGRACAPGSAPSRCAARRCRSSWRPWRACCSRSGRATRPSPRSAWRPSTRAVRSRSSRPGTHRRCCSSPARRRAWCRCRRRRRSGSGRWRRRTATASRSRCSSSRRRRSCSTPTAWSRAGARARPTSAGAWPACCASPATHRRRRTRRGSRPWWRRRRPRTDADCPMTSPCSP